jgi:type IV pilus assembly protein PilQ
MKNIKRISVFSIFVLLWGMTHCLDFCGAEEPGRIILPQLPQTEIRISMDFRDASLKDILKIFSQQSGINFIPSDDVQDKRITLYLENVPVKNAIDSIVSANGLTYEQGPDKNIFIVRASGMVKVKTVTKIYTLSFAQVVPLTLGSAPTTSTGSTGDSSTSSSGSAQSSAGVAASAGIADILSKLLSPNGNIVVDQRTNSLIITDIPEQFGTIEEMLTKLDTPTPQIFIEAEIIETTMDITDKLGLEFGGSDGSWSATYTGPKKGYSFPYDTKTFKDHDQSATFTFGTMSFGDLALTLKALTSHAETKYLARPKLLTLNNETAIIDITSDTYVGSVTTSQPQTQSNTTSAERMTTGVSLRVTPQVNAADYVTMILEPAVARTEASSVNSGFLNPIKRSAKAKVMVKDGETIFIGGLLDNHKTDTKRKVPVLGDVPILGALFKSDTVTDKQTEILIFITPHIVTSKITQEAKLVSEQETVAEPQEASRDKIIEDTVRQLEHKS